jgi:PAS domain S-box-containing protein
MASLMRRTKAELADQVIAQHQRIDTLERGGGDVELAEALMAIEERLKTFIDHTPAPITLKGADRRYILVNTSFCERRGVTHEQVLGKTAHDVYPEETAKGIDEQDNSVFSTGKLLEFDFNSVAPDGSAHNYLAIRFPVFGTEGDVTAVGGVNLEITE